MTFLLMAPKGQQRTAILSMKLAELEFVKKETGEYPLLLLDDVGRNLIKNEEILFSLILLRKKFRLSLQRLMNLLVLMEKK